jgi:hypothetical protein
VEENTFFMRNLAFSLANLIKYSFFSLEKVKRCQCFKPKKARHLEKRRAGKEAHIFSVSKALLV